MSIRLCSSVLVVVMWLVPRLNAAASQQFHAFSKRPYSKDVWTAAVAQLCPANPRAFAEYSWLSCEEFLRAYREAWPHLRIDSYQSLVSQIRSWPEVPCPAGRVVRMYRITSDGRVDENWQRPFRAGETCLLDNNENLVMTSTACWNPIPYRIQAVAPVTPPTPPRRDTVVIRPPRPREERPEVIEIRPYRPRPAATGIERPIPPPPPVLFGVGIGVTSVSIAKLDFTAPVVSVSVASRPGAELTLAGGWRPRSANEFGKRYETLLAGELTIWPPRSYLGFTLGALGAWRALRDEDEYLERVYGPLAGLRLLLTTRPAIILGTDAIYANVSVYGSGVSHWQWGFSPIARLNFTF